MMSIVPFNKLKKHFPFKDVVESIYFSREKEKIGKGRKLLDSYQEIRWPLFWYMDMPKICFLYAQTGLQKSLY